MERPRLNLSPDELVRAYRAGELIWTLHEDCQFTSDPGQWGASLINDAEIMLACLDTAGARSVVEIGAYAGDLTQVLHRWARERGARISAVDPSPQDELVALAQENPEIVLIRATSHRALAELPSHDAFVIDGDHNYYTVSEELRLIAERQAGEPLPLLLFHDVAWPHARRDDYFAPEQVPAEYRQPTKEGGGLFPGNQGTVPGGLPYKYPAAQEGGPRNGVLTAVEDFVAAREDLVLAVVPAFFGLGVVWHREAPYAERMQALLGPLDRHPVIARLEANRVYHLASVHIQLMEVAAAHEQIHRQQQVLRRLLDSRAFALAERLSRLRQRVGIAPEAVTVSKQTIEDALNPSNGR
ncbi:MAG TPA: class I SAM-dependent methyltransferase [Solirubrobacteraceae bacterium]|nr:class I SAM-dependent methyltransferase [Solirubrobacteraceae bacterium]